MYFLFVIKSQREITYELRLYIVKLTRYYSHMHENRLRKVRVYNNCFFNAWYSKCQEKSYTTKNFLLICTACPLAVFDPPCGFSKIISSKERVKLWFSVTFNIILKDIFSENFIEFPQVVQKIWRNSLSVLANFHQLSSIFLIFWHYLVTKKLMTSFITGMSGLFHFQHSLNRLFNNCIKLYWY